MVRRAALHAALGDPGRLTIVDTLAWGEASPGELAARLGMSSNLLAHHLRVLEDAGLLTRHRSEGDRRRSYVALARDVLDLLRPTAPALVAERVVFVCTHNSARSQLAAAMWNDHSPVPATSAGTHPAPRVHPGAVAVARRRHLSPGARHRPATSTTSSTPPTWSSPSATAPTKNSPPTAGTSVGRAGLHWSIPDPVTADDPAAFDTVVDELTDRITRLTPAVHAIPDPKDQERSS